MVASPFITVRSLAAYYFVVETVRLEVPALENAPGSRDRAARQARRFVDDDLRTLVAQGRERRRVGAALAVVRRGDGRGGVLAPQGRDLSAVERTARGLRLNRLVVVLAVA